MSDAQFSEDWDHDEQQVRYMVDSLKADLESGWKLEDLHKQVFADMLEAPQFNVCAYFSVALLMVARDEVVKEAMKGDDES